MSDVKRTHRFLRSLLVAGASLLIIVGGAFAGNALAPAEPVTVTAQSAVDDDSLEARDEDAPAVETPEPAETDEAEPDEVDTPPAPPKPEAIDEGAQVDENDQGQDEDANENDAEDANENDADDAKETDADDASENDSDHADENHDGGGEHDSGDSGDDGEQGD